MEVIMVVRRCEVCGSKMHVKDDICANCYYQVEISDTERQLQNARIEVGRLEDKLRDLNNKLRG